MIDPVPGALAGWEQATLSLLLSFVLSMWMARLYVWTHRGMSYSRHLVQSLVLAGIVAAILMLAIGDNLTRGLGIIGTLALIRFRTNLRDPWDMVFVFGVFALGIASGTGAYLAGLAGTVVFTVAVLVITWGELGARARFDGLLRVQLPAGEEERRALQEVLERWTRSFVLVTLRETSRGHEQEHAYQVRLAAEEHRARLVQEVAAIPGAHGVSLYMQDATVEV